MDPSDTQASTFPVTRRRAAALLVAAGSLGGEARAATSGAELFDDVEFYDQLGEHRTATAADDACSLWLRQRLGASGFAVDLQPFPTPLFEPRTCRLDLARRSVAAFPAWPVVQTSRLGLDAPLVAVEAGDLAGKIALVRLAYGRGAVWTMPRLGEPAMRAARRAAAVVAVTEGPTGGVIAVNAAPGRFDWPVPVVLVAGDDGARLARAAAAAKPVRLVSTGVTTPAATATNVVARRRGDGRTLVVSTPKSGWFHCAGERGSGIAVFLALAATLARATTRDLLFVATSGHELGEAGIAHFLTTSPIPPDRVAAWVHLGANVAVQAVATKSGLEGTGAAASRRRLFIGPEFPQAATTAFAGLDGYDQAMVVDETKAPGELGRIRAAGYAPLAGLVGFSRLFHTRLDRAALATTPAILARVARATEEFVLRVLRAER